MRILAAQCRGWAEETTNPDYAAKMWRASAELEDEAKKMDATASAHPALSALMSREMPRLRLAGAA